MLAQELSAQQLLAHIIVLRNNNCSLGSVMVLRYNKSHVLLINIVSVSKAATCLVRGNPRARLATQ